MSTVFEWDESEMEQLLASCQRDDILPIIERHFAPGSRLLEAGCGAGRWVRFLSDRGFDIKGLEYSGETVDMVQKVWPDLTVVHGDCADSPFPDSSFDGALSLGTVEHWIEGPQKPLADLLRVLRPGGKALITVPCHSTVRQLKNLLWLDEITQGPRALAVRIIKGKKRPLSRIDDRYVFRPYPAWGEFIEYRMTPGEFRGEVEKAGFLVVEHLPVGILDGLYHELNFLGLLVRWRDHQFTTRGPAQAINRWLSKMPFAHSHMQAIVALKPNSIGRDTAAFDTGRQRATALA